MSDESLDGDQKAPEELVRGISPVQYAMWRNDPVTLMFRKYLTDMRQDYLDTAMASWLAGSLTLADEKELRAYVRALAETADLPFDVMKKFYEQVDAAQQAAEEAERPQPEQPEIEGEGYGG